MRHCYGWWRPGRHWKYNELHSNKPNLNPFYQKSWLLKKALQAAVLSVHFILELAYQNQESFSDTTIVVMGSV